MPSTATVDNGDECGAQRLRLALCQAQAGGLLLSSARPVVLLPSYGEPGELPNLTALLALSLAQSGASVLVHGSAVPAPPASTEAVMAGLGLPPCRDAGDVIDRWERRQPAYVPLNVLSPTLAAQAAAPRLVDDRHRRAVARLLCPVHGSRALRVVPVDDDDEARRLGAWAAAARADLVLLRGAAGEPVADARRRPWMSSWLQGRPAPALSLPAQDGPLTHWPVLPQARDAATTALYVQAVLAGEKPMPPPIGEQLTLLLRVLQALDEPVRLASTG
jgi:anthranilate phosphoribosyltransferase